MSLTVNQKVDILMKNFEILSKNLIEKSAACADVLKKMIEYAPEQAFNLWTQLLNDKNVDKYKSIVEMYEDFDQKLPNLMVDFMLSNSQAVKNLCSSEYFTIGGTDVYEYFRSGKSLYNGVLYLINGKEYKKLSEYLNMLFKLKKPDKYKANLLKAVLYYGPSEDLKINAEVIEIINSYTAKLVDEVDELGVIHAYICNMIENENINSAFKFWTNAFKMNCIYENEDMIELFETFDEEIPKKLGNFILKNVNILHKVAESDNFRLNYLANSLAFFFNSSKNKEANDYLQLIFSLNRDDTEKKDFLMKVLDNHIKKLDDDGIEIITHFIEIFNDEELQAELTTKLIKFM